MIGDCLLEISGQVDAQIERTLARSAQTYCRSEDRALLARSQRDWQTYRQGWCKLVENSPGNTQAYVNSAACMLETGRQRLASLVYIVDYGLPNCPPASMSEPVRPNASALSAQKAVIDFSSRDAGRHLANLIEEAHEKTIVYLDWTIKHIARSGLFEQSDADHADTLTSEVLCGRIERRAARPGGVLVFGQPDRDNHHLLLSMTLDTARGAPFARIRCEYAQGAIVLRLRGFFYVTDIGTATALQLELQPIAIPAHRIPASFLENLR
ncbi:DUF1311 domain-containing protein [Bordetella petrii]|nr:DUF1311 domain-containing protein [Bordetella petrii]